MLATDLCKEVFRCHVHRLVLCACFAELELRTALVTECVTILALAIVFEIVHPAANQRNESEAVCNELVTEDLTSKVQARV